MKVYSLFYNAQDPETGYFFDYEIIGVYKDQLTALMHFIAHSEDWPSEAWKQHPPDEGDEDSWGFSKTIEGEDGDEPFTVHYVISGWDLL